MNLLASILFLPELASEQGKHVDQIIGYLHLLMGVLFVGWGIYFAYVLWRFSRKRNPKADPVGAKTSAPKVIELLVAGAETTLLLVIAIPVWSQLSDARKFPTGKDVVNVRVTGQQFQWNFRYPGPDGQFGRQDPKFVTAQNPLGYDPADPAGQDDLTAPLGELHVPVNQPVVCRVTSLDVIHSFKLISMRSMMDAIPGVANMMQFTPNKPGRYEIICAQLCGNGHAKMAAQLVVDTQADYQKWVADHSKKPLAAKQ